jgi:hypothetical protein
MDQEQFTLLATALRWNANGELCSEDFEPLLRHLLALQSSTQH